MSCQILRNQVLLCAIYSDSLFCVLHVLLKLLHLLLVCLQRRLSFLLGSRYVGLVLCLSARRGVIKRLQLLLVL